MKELYVGKSKVEGKGIFVKEAVKKGERIGYIQGKRVRFDPQTEEESASIPTWYGVGKTIWIDPSGTIFDYFNHSCDPNTAIVGTKTIVALKNIKPDTEITFDYSITDVDEGWVMDNCRCGTKRCRKNIRSIQSLPLSVIKRHMPFIPSFFLKAYKRAHPDATI